jgi:SAM-dependent methyltransferase
MASWEELLSEEPGRLQWSAEGIVVDQRLTAAGQSDEREMRDAVAAPFVASREQATYEVSGHHSRGVMLRRARRMVESVPVDGVIVDVGCGFGWHWIELSRARPDVRFILVDFSAVNLRVCRNLMPFQVHRNVICLQASAGDLPIRSEAVSALWTVQVLQHLPPQNRAKALVELARILGSGGAFYVAWLRPVPLLRLIYALAGKRYHLTGNTSYGLYLDRFGPEVSAELHRVFPSGRITYSESLFHPELRCRPRSCWVGNLDEMVSSTPLCRAIARQTEFSGCK